MSIWSTFNVQCLKLGHDHLGPHTMYAETMHAYSFKTIIFRQDYRTFMNEHITFTYGY